MTLSFNMGNIKWNVSLDCFMTLRNVALWLYKADYASERPINYNTDDQQWLSQILLSGSNLSHLAWIWTCLRLTTYLNFFLRKSLLIANNEVRLGFNEANLLNLGQQLNWIERCIYIDNKFVYHYYNYLKFNKSQFCRGNTL